MMYKGVLISSNGEHLSIAHQAINKSNFLIKTLQESPFEQTLYLGSNCIAMTDVSPLFKILEQYDMLVVQDFSNTSAYDLGDIPSSFPFFRYDVLGIKKNETTKTFFEYLKQLQETTTCTSSTFRKACWDSNIRIYVLPPEYNIYFEQYLDIWDKGEVQPMILNTSNALKLYQRLTKPLQMIDQIRYWWRRWKDIYWQIKHF